MKRIKLGIVGIGSMGTVHARSILAGNAPRVELVAICDRDAERLAAFETPRKFTQPRMLFCSGAVDAVLIATPHYSHTTLGIEALKAGLHVLVEKPISVHKADCERLLAAHTRRRQVFAAMFNQRTDNFYKKIRGLVKEGGLGEIRRVNWIITTWFRTGAYYKSGGWRATWAGEGGGVLLNQSPHNLDLFQWMFGMPRRVRAFCKFGRYHNIEVEDDVTAYFEFANGATGVFITSTGEAPGTNRLEVTGERGRLVYEKDRITLMRNAKPMTGFSRTSTGPFATPAVHEIAIRADGHGGQHVEIIKNFADAILDGKPLIAPAREGIRSVELANGILLSTWKNQTIDFPINGGDYARRLKRFAAKSKPRKKVVTPVKGDLASSFNPQTR